MKRVKAILLLSLISIAVMAQNTTENIQFKKESNYFEQFEISASEGFHIQALGKIGSNKIYGIMSVGTQCFHEDYKWGFGLGLGTHLVKKEDFASNLEFVSYHINEDEIWTNSYNGLQQLRLTFDKKISERTRVFVGPTFNLLVTRNKTEYVNPFDSTFAPYEIFSDKGSKSTLRGWIGLSAGLRF